MRVIVDPSDLVFHLRRIAAAIENSKSPSRKLVANDLGLLVRKLSSKPNYLIGLPFNIPYEMKALLTDLGYKDDFGRFTELTDDEFKKLSELETLVKKAGEYWKSSGSRLNVYWYCDGQTYTKKSLQEYIQNVIEEIFNAVKARHIANFRTAR